MRWTPQQLADYERRQAPKTRQPAPEQGVEREFALHGEIMCFCANQWPKWIALHGDPSSRTGRTLGEPDFVILAPGRMTILVECKTRTGKLSEDQRNLHHEAGRLDHPVYVVRSMAEFLALEEVKTALHNGGAAQWRCREHPQEGHHD